jgi:hypothetical protein
VHCAECALSTTDSKQSSFLIGQLERRLDFAKKARSVKAQSGFGLKGGEKSKSWYLAEHFSRLFAIKLSEAGELDNLKLSEIMPFLPDQNHHTDPISDMTIKELRATFDVEPLKIGMWCCLANKVSWES